MKTKPMTLRFEEDDLDLAINHSGMKPQKLFDFLLSSYTQPLKKPVPAFVFPEIKKVKVSKTISNKPRNLQTHTK